MVQKTDRGQENRYNKPTRSREKVLINWQGSRETGTIDWQGSRDQVQ